MGMMRMWNNHRARQSGKYAKLAARQPPMGYHPMPYQPMPPTINTQGIWQSGYNQGWEKGWHAGQRDLVQAIQSGRLTWDEAVKRLT